MNVLFDRKFFEDIKIIRDVEFKKKIEKLIEKIEVASILAEIQNISKIKGAQNAYRIRIGNYRIGIFKDKSTLKFIRCLHRKEIYRYFP